MLELHRLIGNTIRSKRGSLNLTIADLSILTGLNITNLRRIETGVGNPKISTIERIYRVLGINPKQGLTDE